MPPSPPPLVLPLSARTQLAAKQRPTMRHGEWAKRSDLGVCKRKVGEESNKRDKLNLPVVNMYTA